MTTGSCEIKTYGVSLLIHFSEQKKNEIKEKVHMNFLLTISLYGNNNILNLLNYIKYLSEHVARYYQTTISSFSKFYNKYKLYNKYMYILNGEL